MSSNVRFLHFLESFIITIHRLIYQILQIMTISLNTYWHKLKQASRSWAFWEGRLAAVLAKMSSPATRERTQTVLSTVHKPNPVTMEDSMTSTMEQKYFLFILMNDASYSI